MIGLANEGKRLRVSAFVPGGLSPRPSRSIYFRLAVFVKLFSQCFPSTLKSTALVFNFSGLHSVLEKLCFHDGLV